MILCRVCAMQQNKTNCHSFKIAEGFDGPHPYDYYTSITKTLDLKVNGSFQEDSFIVMFKTESETGVEFKVKVIGERLGETYQVKNKLIKYFSHVTTRTALYRLL